MNTARAVGGTARRIARRAALGALAALLVAAIGIGGLYLHSPAESLNLADRLFPGRDAITRVADGVAFAPGTANRLDVWAAPASADARRPVLVFFYGGSWVSGRRQDYGFVGRAYASRGFVTVIPDYRKVPEVHFPAFIQDGAAAVRWVRDNIGRYGGDPDRIVLAGHSAGGYIAVMLALDGRYLAAEHLPRNAVKAVAGLAGPYDFYPFTWPEAKAALGNAADPQQTQPIHFARRDAPPLWLATGTADTTVEPRNAIVLASREKALGAPSVTLRRYAGLGHPGIVMALSRPFRAVAPVLEESSAFLERHVEPSAVDKAR